MMPCVAPAIRSEQLLCREFSFPAALFRVPKRRRLSVSSRALVAAQVKSSTEAEACPASSGHPGRNSLSSVITMTSHQLLSKVPHWSLPASIGVGAAICLVLAAKFYSNTLRRVGSVSELIRRGQLRSDRKGDLRPLKYEDPFNNPMMKAGSKNPLVRMCGKMFRLAPVTLTEEKVASHQNRRIQAYQWRRPVVFLKEGDPLPEGVDPDEVRWIPSNHPFATTTDYIDEELAQKNIYQTRGVPSRVRAEHEALRRKMKMKEDVQPKGQDDFFGGKSRDSDSVPQRDPEASRGPLLDQDSGAGEENRA